MMTIQEMVEKVRTLVRANPALTGVVLAAVLIGSILMIRSCTSSTASLEAPEATESLADLTVPAPAPEALEATQEAGTEDPEGFTIVNVPASGETPSAETGEVTYELVIEEGNDLDSAD